LTIRPANDPPVAGPDAVTTEEGTGTLVNVLANDSSGPDIGEVLSVDAVQAPAHGSVIAFDGQFRYTPQAGFTADTFTYILGDGNGGQAPGTVTVTVTPTSGPVHANDDVAAVSEAPDVTIAVLANDSAAPGATLTIQEFTQPSHGSVTRVGGLLRYTPAAGFTGSDLFGYRAVDDQGRTDSAIVVVTVRPVDAPANARVVGPAGLGPRISWRWGRCRSRYSSRTRPVPPEQCRLLSSPASSMRTLPRAHCSSRASASARTASTCLLAGQALRRRPTCVAKASTCSSR
jgi:hypothetical protein